MLVAIRGNLVRAKVQGLSEVEMLSTEPAADYAANNDGTREWLVRHYAEYTQ